MKRIVSIVLLLLLVLDMVGVLAIFNFRQFQIRKEIKHTIKQGISMDQLHEIVVHSNEVGNLKWITDNEFAREGNLYDIIRTVHVGDSIIYFCINDIQEEKLFACLDDWVKKQSESDPVTHHTLIRFLKVFADGWMNTMGDYTLCTIQSGCNYRMDSFDCPEMDYPVNTPPPKA